MALLIDHTTDVRMLKLGFRFCCACGKVCIRPDADQGVVKCDACLEEMRPGTFCRYCGEEIDRKRLEYARKFERECRQCWYCSKNAKKHCLICHVLHPDHWHRPN